MWKRVKHPGHDWIEAHQNVYGIVHQGKNENFDCCEQRSHNEERVEARHEASMHRGIRVRAGELKDTMF